MAHKDLQKQKCIRGDGGRLRAVTLRLAAEDVAVLDGLTRVYGSRARAARFVLSQVGMALLELHGEVARLGGEVAGLREDLAAVRAAVERLELAGMAPRQHDCREELQPEDERAVKQVLGALLGMSRTARVD
ncbi:MAG: hypothetical protein AB1609_12225 [Bacillota bacterium]